MIPCIIESPFKGATKAEEQRNHAYLDKCIRWCIENGYTPYASHKMLPDALDDSNPNERTLGISAGLDMSLFILSKRPDAKVFFFLDYGQSGGMNKAEEKYLAYDFANRISGKMIGTL
jgi:hypothetical protein